MTPGTRVLRTGSSPTVGIVVRCSETHAAVDWPAPNRRGGRGWQRSVLNLSGLILATEEEVTRRKHKARAHKQAGELARDRQRMWTCLNTAGHPYRTKVLHLTDNQVDNGRCVYCQAPVILRESLF